jgi:hypothetical protein
VLTLDGDDCCIDKRSGLHLDGFCSQLRRDLVKQQPVESFFDQGFSKSDKGSAFWRSF